MRRAGLRFAEIRLAEVDDVEALVKRGLAAICVFILLPGTSFAENRSWKKLETGSLNGGDWFDAKSVRIEDGKVYFEKVTDYTSQLPDDGRYRSTLSASRIDCVNKTLEILSYAAYSGNMATGSQIWITRNIIRKPLDFLPLKGERAVAAIYCTGRR